MNEIKDKSLDLLLWNNSVLVFLILNAFVNTNILTMKRCLSLSRKIRIIERTADSDTLSDNGHSFTNATASQSIDRPCLQLTWFRSHKCDGLRQWFLTFPTSGTPTPKGIGLGTLCLRSSQRMYVERTNSIVTNG